MCVCQGAGRLLRDSGKHPAQLRSEVCTPGGTTIYGLHSLEQGGVRASTMSAVESATERARELGRKSSTGSRKWRLLLLCTHKGRDSRLTMNWLFFFAHLVTKEHKYKLGSFLILISSLFTFFITSAVDLCYFFVQRCKQKGMEILSVYWQVNYLIMTLWPVFLHAHEIIQCCLIYEVVETKCDYTCNHNNFCFGNIYKTVLLPCKWLCPVCFLFFFGKCNASLQWPQSTCVYQSGKHRKKTFKPTKLLIKFWWKGYAYKYRALLVCQFVDLFGSGDHWIWRSLFPMDNHITSDGLTCIEFSSPTSGHDTQPGQTHYLPIMLCDGSIENELKSQCMLYLMWPVDHHSQKTLQPDFSH